MTPSYIFNVTFVSNLNEVSIMYRMNNPSVISRMVVNESGLVQRLTWNGRDQRWIGIWSAPKDQCDGYSQCGKNSNCDPYKADDFICNCLPGFEPESPREWYLRDGSKAKYRKSRPLAKAGIQAALIVSVGVALFLIVFLVCCFIRKKKKGKQIPSAVIPEH
ncbi:hypothetical protein DKX38_016964 [Salix brachista]|uniref:EGF-like domain-containing protein n=1 Tax=Salix brachista TaxID=2182728 RepID=A0A5N5KUQ9_9ROSI|nr:hypothetical protein DKX38_016964 [Salix brachista]